MACPAPHASVPIWKITDEAIERSMMREAMKTGCLYQSEYFWRHHQPWLAQRGYMLRPRYRPDWQPSWGTKLLEGWDPYEKFEDGLSTFSTTMMDATRSDGTPVVLKFAHKSYNAYETFITSMYAPRGEFDHPHNHNTPILDVFPLPEDDDVLVMVLPLLRAYDDPPFDTVGEAIAFFQQMFEGLSWIHSLGIAHRDIKDDNIMMDPSGMFPDSFHFMKPARTPNLKKKVKPFTRTQRPPAYYIIDFGISDFYCQRRILAPIVIPGDKSVPEHQECIRVRYGPKPTENPEVGSVEDEFLANPFATDIYLLGNLIRKDFIMSKHNFGFMSYLVDDMTNPDPKKRPSAEEALARFLEIKNYLSTSKLRSRVVPRKENILKSVARAVSHWRRRLGYMTRGTPAVPLPARPSAETARPPWLPVPALTRMSPEASASVPIPPEFLHLVSAALARQGVSS